MERSGRAAVVEQKQTPCAMVIAGLTANRDVERMCIFATPNSVSGRRVRFAEDAQRRRVEHLRNRVIGKTDGVIPPTLVRREASQRRQHAIVVRMRGESCLIRRVGAAEPPGTQLDVADAKPTPRKLFARRAWITPRRGKRVTHQTARV